MKTPMYCFVEGVTGEQVEAYLNTQAEDGYLLDKLLTQEWQGGIYYAVATKRDEHRPIMVADAALVSALRLISKGEIRQGEMVTLAKDALKLAEGA